MTTSSAPHADALYVLQTDGGKNLLMCVAPERETGNIGWWPLCEIDGSFAEEPFTRLNMDEQEHCTEIVVSQLAFPDLAAWLAERDTYWSVRGLEYPLKGDITTAWPYRFSFSDDVVATEFKLRWG
jgi:hypothetical protein